MCWFLFGFTDKKHIEFNIFCNSFGLNLNIFKIKSALIKTIILNEILDRFKIKYLFFILDNFYLKLFDALFKQNKKKIKLNSELTLHLLI